MTSKAQDKYDVVIVGASIAGCAAAIMYAQQGLRIALLDARSDARAHKVLCTHHLQPCGAPILQRLGATEKLLALGMVQTVPKFWTPWGWITPDATDASSPPGFNVRRETLDPLLRQLANDYPNVDLLLGHRVSGLLTKNGTTAGVYGTAQGSAFTLEAKLTVGADGKDSTVARSARCDSETVTNGRFSYFAQLSGLERLDEESSLSWFMDPDVAYLLPNDGGISVLVVFPALDKLDSFTDDLSTAFLEYANALPGAPPIRREHIVGKIVGTKHFSTTLTEPVGNGFALIGDAAATNDPLWGIGCSWALETAQMLVDATAQVLAETTAHTLDSHRNMNAALTEYRSARASMTSHIDYMSGYAGGRKFTVFERLLISAATHDQGEAQRFYLFGSRLIPAEQYLSARSVVRAAQKHLRHRLRRGSVAGT
ncbi:NAD(P)/FAD-dependent oxidoreductase [Rhodococcus sp. NPDC059969]|uniref:NAD(P)/FAD-dependent oxidoreductase n=1 Tax=Rhodococcus sp. NPDC059969 TaxID=3347018 RepID=UPI00366EFB9B